MEKAEVKINGLTFVFGGLTAQAHDRLLEKRVADNGVIGERELVLSTLIEAESDGGLEQLQAALARKPAAIRSIASAVIENGKGPEPEVLDDVVKVGGITFSSPELPAWEEMREKLSAEGAKFGPGVRAFLVSLADKTEEASAYFERYPASIESIYAGVGKLAGTDIEVVTKKG